MIVGANGDTVQEDSHHNNVVEPVAVRNLHHQLSKAALVVEEVQRLVAFVVKDQPVDEKLAIL